MNFSICTDYITCDENENTGILMHSFWNFWQEHLVAPFFVFQVLCLFLWSLDDYWYYSVFTLLLLMFFEGMMCKQRQASLLMLREMRRPPVDMYVQFCLFVSYFYYLFLIIWWIHPSWCTYYIPTIISIIERSKLYSKEKEG